MKIKKAGTCLVETIVYETDSVQFVVRNVQGQPLEVVSTPAELSTVFVQFSAAEPAPQD